MNNFTFGDSGMGYYETIAGGAGAGPSWHGRSGVHTHMTNTRITGMPVLDVSSEADSAAASTAARCHVRSAQ
jgi:N-methylhydantoinase B/oxoprolinase/acetone carboxylase alpha subunit